MKHAKTLQSPQECLGMLIERQKNSIEKSNTIELRENKIDSETLKKLLQVFVGRKDVVSIYIRNSEASFDLIEIAKTLVKKNSNLMHTDIERVCDLGLGVRRGNVFPFVRKFLEMHDSEYTYSNAELYIYIKHRYAIACTLLSSRDVNPRAIVKKFQSLCVSAWQTDCFAISLICKPTFALVFNFPQDVVDIIMSYIEFEDIKQRAVEEGGVRC